MTTYRFVITAALLALATAATAEDHKKLYCWNDNGHKTCGDALPPEAAAHARTVINADNGMHTGEIARPPTPEERAAAAVAASQEQMAADARTAAERRDLAMVESYNTEADLRRAYGERTALLDTGMKASTMGKINLRLSMVSLLNEASDLELSGKPVPQVLVAKLQAQHADMIKQKRILAVQQRDRAALDSELADALTRYRTLKQAEAGGAVTTAPAPAVPPKN